MSSRRSDDVDPPSEHAVLTVEMLIQGAACRADGTILAGGTKSHGLPRALHHSGIRS